MKNKIKLILAASLLSVAAASAQTGGVGVGTTTPDASAALDVTSSTKGFLMPRMTTAQRTAIATPATGLQVYDTDTNSQWYFNGTVWVNAATAGQKWIDGATAGDIELVNPTGTETIKFTNKGFKEISKTLTTIPTLSGASYLNNPITDYNMYNHKYYKSSEIPLNPATSNIAFVQNMALIDGADTRTATSNILTENALTIDPSNSTTYSSATANFNKLLHYGTGFTTNLFADANYTRLGYGGTATHIYGSHSTVDFRGAGTTTNHVGVYSSPQINNASGTITNVIGYRAYLAFGSSSTNISNLFINNADYAGVGASYTGTITNSYDFYANNFNPTAATVTNKFGIYSNGIDKNNSLLGNLLVGNSANSATAKADASAQLEVKSTTKGFLMPRMTTAQRTAIATPATGLQVYDTTTKSLWFYNGTVWVVGTTGTAKFVDGTTPVDAVFTAGNVGIGTTTPTEKLEVNGAIKIGETSAATPTAGTIRFNSTTNKFEGYDGTAWVAFH